MYRRHLCRTLLRRIDIHPTYLITECGYDSDVLGGHFGEGHKLLHGDDHLVDFSEIVEGWRVEFMCLLAIDADEQHRETG